MNAALAGTGGLIRLVLRRDRILLPLWVLLLAVLPASYASTFAGLYPTQAERAGYVAGTAANPSIVALLGPVYSDSIGALAVQRSGMLLLIVALISLLTVIRHTRTEEEAGRRELLGATALGRHAGLTAALLVTYAADLLLGLIAAAGLVAADLPVAGALAFGAALTVSGWVFASIGGLAAQLTTGAGGARGIGLALLGLAFVLRLAGDAAEAAGGSGWLSWLSPLGWVERVRAFADERWWVLLPGLALTVLAAALAYPISARRDLGAGVLAPRSGPAVAAPGLASPLALAWRLHRGLLLGWAIGAAALGAILGSVADAAGQAVGDNPKLAEIMARLGGTAALSDAYLAGVMTIVGLAVAGYGIQAALRMRAEETAGRAEPVLAAAVGRTRWLGGHLLLAAVGPVVALAVGGVAAGLTYGLATGDVSGQVPRLLGAALVQVPAVWVLTGLAVLLSGALPRAAGASWAGLAGCFLLGQLGAVLELGQWALDVSPFTHIPRLPGGEVMVLPLLVLTVVAAVFAGIGVLAFRRRDVPVT
ncbi:ABC transporter permease [Micromonospora echinofusca]|uniref:ABC transporter permease n=1 Tax=Micromonospora echinofusca TaxID=47858 RepID=A0ABS3VSS0_MICEH|nr:ABC transporter permease [Micromonospora echinofusca]MBO4207579.1 ABC transporter permease [Micromonospora echinofusca]